MLNGEGVPTYSFTWEEGKYFDLWMIVHLCTGVIIGLSAHLVGLSPLIAYTGTSLGLALYEIVEEVFGIEETIENRLTDIVFGLIGFVAMYEFVSPALSLGLNQMLLVIFGIFAIVSQTFGWLAYKRRTASESKIGEVA